MRDEVRHHILISDQTLGGRDKYFIIYNPIGTLERYGVHNDVGTDIYKTEGVIIRCAQKCERPLFSPLYYGESLPGLPKKELWKASDVNG
ncbi:MAG TPA: hypothetical protein VFD57_06640 [Clostridia bacterium]|nr:hypothetical protein [Clostridia bacterium]